MQQVYTRVKQRTKKVSNKLCDTVTLQLRGRVWLDVWRAMAEPDISMVYNSVKLTF